MYPGSLTVLISAAIALLTPTAGFAQQPATDTTRAAADSAFRLAPINVTATRSPVSTFDTPAHVSVIGGSRVREARSNNIADLFLDLPGLDAEGVGPVQRKPVIRGMIGQRVLLLEDGLRLNNTRREQDRGESPALVNAARIDRVEVVRGAASVLYGSDAVGGVVNIITRDPGRAGGNVTGGLATARFSSAGDQRASSFSAWHSNERISFDLNASYRKADSYSSPSGTFGDLTLPSEITVNDTGVEDFSLGGTASLAIAPGQRLRLKQSYYRAHDAGFGYVAPEDLGGPGLKVQLLFPDQTFARTSLSYSGLGLRLPFADRVDVSAYYQSNEREFNTLVSGPLGPPGAALNSITENFTDLDTWGMRIEAKKNVLGSVLVTYGTDFFRDGSQNTDTSTRTVTGFGPPATRTSGTRIPNATFNSGGAFLQAQLHAADRLEITLGGRFQNVHTTTNTTAGLTAPEVSSSDQTVVGAANALLRVSDRVNLVASVGRAFRSPNLVERFFQGVSPDGRAYWSINPGLSPETSFNREIGLKFNGPAVEVEGYLFRNTVHDGIQDLATGDMVDGLPVRENRNLDEIRFSGFELQTTFNTEAGFAGTIGLSHLSGVADTSAGGSSSIPGETFSTKLVGRAAYTTPSGLLTLNYGVRFTSRKENVDWRSSPLGDVAPSYAVHTAGFVVRPFPDQAVRVTVDNLFNELYAETANMAFFRPEPGRNITVSVEAGF